MSCTHPRASHFDMPPDPLPDNQQVVPLNSAILSTFACDLVSDAQILDFGCGSGRHTYEYLDAGFPNTVGFDVQDLLEPRDESDRSRFFVLPPDAPFRLPFPDNYFDFITSTSVFEHVMNPGEAISEIARVLKPGGATLHVFPSRWRPIEPHMFVPLAGVIQSRWWFSLWARFGVRNAYQRGMTVEQTVARNIEFCRSGIHYPPFAALDALWRRSFARVEYAERAFIGATRRFSRISQLASRLQIVPGFIQLYRRAHFCVLLARQPRDLP